MTSPIPEVGVLVEYGDEFWMEDMARELSAAGTYHPLWTVFAGLMERHFVASEEAADVDVIQRACKRFYSLTGGVEQVNLPFKVGPLQPKEAMMLLMGRQQLEARACSVPIDALTSLPAEIAIFGDIHFVVKLRSPSDVIKVSFHTQLVQHHFRATGWSGLVAGTAKTKTTRTKRPKRTRGPKESSDSAAGSSAKRTSAKRRLSLNASPPKTECKKSRGAGYSHQHARGGVRVRGHGTKEPHVLVRHELRLQGLERELSEVEEPGPEEGLQSVPKRLGCICHLINTVCTAAQCTDSNYKELNTAVLSFQGRFNKSSKLTGELLAASGGLKLGSHCPTRWLGMVPVLQRLARVKDAVIAVCKSNKWNLPFEWDEVDDAIRLLLPWFKAVATLSADTTPTINLVVAECLGLVDQTEDYLSGSPHFESFGTNLVRELKKRLAGSVFNLRQAAPNAEPLYLIAALLDPYTAPALDDATFDAAKEELVRHLKNKTPPKYKEDDIIFDINDDIFIDNSAAPIPGVKRRREPRVSEGIHVVHKPAVQRVVNPDHVQYLKAVSCYVRFLEAQQLDHGGAYHENRVWRFWTGTHDFRPLRDTALAALVVPASSTAAERMFSIAGHLTGGRNGQLGPQVLNAKLTMRLNADALKSMK